MATDRIEYRVFLGLTDQFNMDVWFQRSEVAVRKAHRADRLITILLSHGQNNARKTALD